MSTTQLHNTVNGAVNGTYSSAAEPSAPNPPNDSGTNGTALPAIGTEVNFRSPNGFSAVFTKPKKVARIEGDLIYVEGVPAPYLLSLLLHAEDTVRPKQKAEPAIKPMAPFTFTRVRNAKGPLSKKLWLDETGVLRKTPAADLTDGTADRVQFESLEAFAADASALKKSQGFIYGTAALESARVITQKALKKGAEPGTIARDLEHFAWPDGPGIQMFDIDKPANGKIWSAEELDALLCEVLPWWSCIRRFYKPSVSAFIETKDGVQLSGAGSWRCYTVSDIAKNIPFVGVAIADTFWKAGHGRIEFSAPGSMLVRCPIDTAVWSPERLDFAGPPELGKGLRKAPPSSHLLRPG